jgi:uncharacterized protein
LKISNFKSKVKRKNLAKKILVHNTTCDENLSQWKDVPVNKSTPFIHKIDTGNNKYIYDVNSSEILRVDDIVWDIVKVFGSLPKEKIVAKYSTKYLPDEVLAAYERIVDAQKINGLLLSKRPEVIFEITEENNNVITESLAHDRTQLCLNVTEDCNFRCKYCPYSRESDIHRRKHASRMMSWETAKLAIDDFIGHSRPDSPENIRKPALCFYGGEPLLNFALIKKCVEYVRKKSKKQFVFQVTTNGALLLGEKAEFFASKGFIVTVSLDGPKHIHDKNRRTIHGSGTWKVVINNIESFIDKYSVNMNKNGGCLTINAVLPPEGSALEFEEFFCTIDLFAKTDIRASLMSLPEPERFNQSVGKDGYAYHDIHKLKVKYLRNLEESKVKPHLREFIIQRNFFEERYIDIHKRNYACRNHRFFPDYYAHGLPTCIPGTRRCHVSVDGNYYPCERVPECEQLKIGDVYKGINVAKVYALYKRFFDCCKDQCGYCWLLGMCQVGCFANIREGHNLTKEAMKNACAWHRRSMHRKLTNYCAVMEKNPHAFDYLNNVERV